MNGPPNQSPARWYEIVAGIAMMSVGIAAIALAIAYGEMDLFEKLSQCFSHTGR